MTCSGRTRFANSKVGSLGSSFLLSLGCCSHSSCPASWHVLIMRMMWPGGDSSSSPIWLLYWICSLLKSKEGCFLLTVRSLHSAQSQRIQLWPVYLPHHWPYRAIRMSVTVLCLMCEGQMRSSLGSSKDVLAWQCRWKWRLVCVSDNQDPAAGSEEVCCLVYGLLMKAHILHICLPLVPISFWCLNLTFVLVCAKNSGATKNCLAGGSYPASMLIQIQGAF